MRRPVCGVSLVEILVAAAVLALLLVSLLGIYVMGSTIFQRTDVQSELVSTLQTTSARLSRDLRQTVFTSLTLLPDGRAASFLSPTDGSGGALFDAEGKIVWQSYLIWYYEPLTDRVFRRQLPLVEGALQRTQPGPIELYNPGTGRRQLRDYLREGQVVARDISGFRISVPSRTRMMQITLIASKTAYGKPEAERMTLRASVRPRN